MSMRITIAHAGKVSVHESAQKRVLIGRPGGATPTDLDLSPDPSVSRQHAVLEVKNGACWITDIGSSHGTLVNGREIKGQGERRLYPGDQVVLGETRIEVELVSQPIAPSLEEARAKAVQDKPVRVLQSVETGHSVAMAAVTLDTAREQSLALLCDLPLQFAHASSLDALLEMVVQQAVKLVPAAKRGAILLRGADQDALLLKAFVSEKEPSVSLTLAERTLAERRAILWRRETEADLTPSMRRLQIETGIYVPLLWQDQPLGVLCLDTPEPSAVFGNDDLRLVISVAQYAAVAVANHQLQQALSQNARLLERLLANFSPKLRDVLLERARQGRLRPGGMHSEVTLLLCDLCGFTQTAATMETSDVVEMVNDYLHTVAQVIFEHDGTIDKYIGDAMLAVFGSPEPDPCHCEKAVRAAAVMQQRIAEVNARRVAGNEAACRAAIGVHCGAVFHGFIGTAERLEFTVIGDAVNRTARYCSFAGADGVLISSAVFQHVFHLVEAEKVIISPKEGELVAYRVKGLRDEPRA